MTSRLVRAARDPQMLGATLKLWPKQEELLASLEMPESTHIWAIGRQASKSTLGAIAAVHNCALRPDLDAMVPHGRIRYVLAAAPGEAQAREFVGLCAALVEASDFLRGMAQVKTDRIDFTLPSGARTAIRAMPANSRSVRGVSASLIVLDEFAHFSDTSGPGSDERMYAALEPSTRVFGVAARMLLISTPFGETGRFYELFRAAQSGLLPSARVEHAPVWEIDMRLTEEWRERKRIEVGEDIFRQEYGAEFIAGGGQFFDLRGVEYEDGPARPEDITRVVAGLDPAFHADKFGVAVLGESVNEPGVLLAGVLDGIAPGGRLKSLDRRRGREDATLAKVWELLEPYAGSGLQIVTDQHQSDAVSSYFGRLGVAVRVVHLNGPKQTAAFTSMRTRLIDGSLRLWKHQPLIEELRRVRAGSTESIELPRHAGSHMDIASAAALAVYELRGVSGEPEGGPAAGCSLWAEANANLPAPTIDRSFDRHGNRRPHFTVDTKF
jgi:Terminase large subunit, T4likevirus-type, N-terminal